MEIELLLFGGILEQPSRAIAQALAWFGGILEQHSRVIARTLAWSIHGLSGSLLKVRVTPKLPCVSFSAERHYLQ